MRTASTATDKMRGLMIPLLALATLAGCGRSLTIRQDSYINTGGQVDRQADKRTGEPLEVSIVCVYPKDLNKPGNDLLRPDGRITCKDWYQHRPVAQQGEPGRFELPREQVYLLTDDDRFFGRRIGQALRGATLDGEAPIKKGPLQFKWGELHSNRAVIYVFPKFIGKDGAVLPVLPAKLHPPGAYTADLEIKIGVDADRPLEEAQYVKVLTERKLHGGEE